MITGSIAAAAALIGDVIIGRYMRKEGEGIKT